MQKNQKRTNLFRVAAMAFLVLCAATSSYAELAGMQDHEATEESTGGLRPLSA